MAPGRGKALLAPCSAQPWSGRWHPAAPQPWAGQGLCSWDRSSSLLQALCQWDRWFHAKRVPRKMVCCRCGLCLHPVRADWGVPSPSMVPSLWDPKPAPTQPGHQEQADVVCAHSQRRGEPVADHNTHSQGQSCARAARAWQGQRRLKEGGDSSRWQPWCDGDAAGPPQQSSAQD